MVDAHEGKLHRPGAAGDAPPGTPLDVAQLPGEQPVHGGTGQGVEVAAQDGGGVALGVSQPFRPRDGLCLGDALAPVQSEMSGQHLDLAAVQFHFGPYRAPALIGRVDGVGRNRPRLDQAHWCSAQYGIAVASLLHLDRGMEVKGHLQCLRDQVGLVGHMGPLQAGVQFLQRHDVRIADVDHLGDPQGGDLAVDADATVHIIGHHGKGF